METIMNLVFDSTKSEWFAFYHTNSSHESSVKFCVIEVFKFWVRYRYEENKEWQEPNIGYFKAPKVIFKEYPSK